jgi:hypothetical protein
VAVPCASEKSFGLAVPLADEVRQAEDFVVPAEADVEQANDHAPAAQSLLVKGRNLDLIELGERRSVDGVAGSGGLRRPGSARFGARWDGRRRFAPAEGADDVEMLHSVERGQRPDPVGRDVDAQRVEPARHGPDADRPGPDLVGVIRADREVLEIDEIRLGPDLGAPPLGVSAELLPSLRQGGPQGAIARHPFVPEIDPDAERG